VKSREKLVRRRRDSIAGIKWQAQKRDKRENLAAEGAEGREKYGKTAEKSRGGSA
jgi:hypothetical protein